MEFAGREYIYLPQKKIDKLKGYKSEDKKEGEENENQNVAPLPQLNLEKKMIEKKVEENEEKDAPPPLNPKEKPKENHEEENLNKIEDNENKKEIKDEEISCDSNSYCTISNEHLNDKYSNNDSYEDNCSCDSVGYYDNNNSVSEEEKNYIQETDINIFSVDYNEILNKDFSLKENPIRCKKCTAILNIYSNLNLIENDKYKWECEFCKQVNIIKIKKDSIPLNKNIDYILQEPIIELKTPENKENEEKKVNLNDDTSLIFCFDISGSMDERYNVGKDIYDKVKECLGSMASNKEINENLASEILLDSNKNKKKNIFKRKLSVDELDDELDSVSIGSNTNSYGSNSYDLPEYSNGYKISRLEMIKFSIYSMINKLLKESPNIKVGLVTFETSVTIYGDCLKDTKKIIENENEKKIKSLGDEYSYLISNPISKSSNYILSRLYKIKTLGCTALGPGIVTSLSLLKNVKKGSRIFLCTDGLANQGVGSISESKEKAKLFYEQIGEEAEKKGISINLITFKDEHSEIEILMKMVEKSGGEITRVTPENIIEQFSGLVESNIIGVDTNLEIILPNILKFRNENYEKLENFESKYKNYIGNAKNNMIDYFEFKFKKSRLLSDMKLNLNELKKLPIQCIIEYKDKNNGKYVKVFTELKSVSSNKEEILKQANLKIVSGNAIQKSAKMAMEGNYKKAQINSKAWKKFLNSNKNKDNNAKDTYSQFKANMNNFNQNLAGAQKKNNNNGISDRLAGQIYNLSKANNQENKK